MGTAGLGIAGAVRLGRARRGVVWQVPVEQGMVRNRRQGPSRCGFAGWGKASQATYGTARFGKEGYGIAGLVRRVAVG